jgi:hypothetical protein
MDHYDAQKALDASWQTHQRWDAAEGVYRRMDFIWVRWFWYERCGMEYMQLVGSLDHGTCVMSKPVLRPALRHVHRTPTRQVVDTPEARKAERRA